MAITEDMAQQYEEVQNQRAELVALAKEQKLEAPVAVAEQRVVALLKTPGLEEKLSQLPNNKGFLLDIGYGSHGESGWDFKALLIHGGKIKIGPAHDWAGWLDGTCDMTLTESGLESLDEKQKILRPFSESINEGVIPCLIDSKNFEEISWQLQSLLHDKDFPPLSLVRREIEQTKTAQEFLTKILEDPEVIERIPALKDKSHDVVQGGLILFDRDISVGKNKASNRVSLVRNPDDGRIGVRIGVWGKNFEGSWTTGKYQDFYLQNEDLTDVNGKNFIENTAKFGAYYPPYKSMSTHPIYNDLDCIIDEAWLRIAAYKQKNPKDLDTWLIENMIRVLEGTGTEDSMVARDGSLRAEDQAAYDQWLEERNKFFQETYGISLQTSPPWQERVRILAGKLFSKMRKLKS